MAKRPEYPFSPNPHRQRNKNRAERAIAQGGRPEGRIRVRLDHRTIITLNSVNALAAWQQRYPKAEIIA